MWCDCYRRRKLVNEGKGVIMGNVKKVFKISESETDWVGCTDENATIDDVACWYKKMIGEEPEEGCISLDKQFKGCWDECSLDDVTALAIKLNDDAVKIVDGLIDLKSTSCKITIADKGKEIGIMKRKRDFFIYNFLENIKIAETFEIIASTCV